MPARLTSLRQLYGEGDAIHSVTIAHVDSGETERSEVDAVVVSHGYTQDCGELLKRGLDIGKHGIRTSGQTESGVACTNADRITTGRRLIACHSGYALKLN